jgi:hypothetical protein
LQDLARRRELATQQLRGLFAGREALVASLRQVEETSKTLTSDLDTFVLEPAAFVSLETNLQEQTMVDANATVSVTKIETKTSKDTKKTTVR